ncbi:hypothetical protein BACINT_00937 [Bacteroides intestinalis DSM 17393]|uniref:Uncharacterized protein n=1 Tax=Bacteroides intestinalis DSM 17393 TaxID=471870 RepID=B3C8X4_9BACE|nr:hypothetical protein BACINT_00937 [Bacteroides intestinalis DSM 17393]
MLYSSKKMLFLFKEEKLEFISTYCTYRNKSKIADGHLLVF